MTEPVVTKQMFVVAHRFRPVFFRSSSFKKSNNGSFEFPLEDAQVFQSAQAAANYIDDWNTLNPRSPFKRFISLDDYHIIPVLVTRTLIPSPEIPWPPPTPAP